MTISSAFETTRTSYPPKLRTLTVVRIEALSATMRRVVLTGEELEAEFPIAPLSTATHVKVVVPQEDSGEVVLPTLGEHGLSAPDGVELAIRDYTVRAFDPVERSLTLDFVLHDHGPAGRWAITAKPGDRLGVLGPRGYRVYPACSHYLLGADETALPALERWLEEVPREARVDVVVLAPAAGRRELPHHPRLRLQWIEGSAEDLVAALVSRSSAGTFLWAAGESGIVAPLRRHLQDAGADRTAFDVSGYWRLGRAGSGDRDKKAEGAS
ncbi:siderophore-interacting protein [Lentzea sp. NPDC058436]|uniref:siderophore-interacting protein n=1 Tax=Lentzea sp. NPDC058436 TaxID=3346499 RepID=UPI0036598208